MVQMGDPTGRQGYSLEIMGSNRNVIPMENAVYLIDCKSIKQNSVDTTRSLINKIFKCQTTFFWPCDEKKEARTRTTGMIEGKTARKDVGWT